MQTGSTPRIVGAAAVAALLAFCAFPTAQQPPSSPFSPDVEEFVSFIHPEDRDYARTVIGDAIKQGKTIEYEFRAVLPEV